MTSLPTTTPPKASGPAFYRWLIMTLGIVILLLVLYRVTDSEDAPPPPNKLPKMSVIPPFTLTERSGRTITNQDLDGKIWVADFVYTTCPGPCPLVTAELAKIEQTVIGDPNVQLVTFTVDPTNDTPAVLAAYADKFHADPNKWWFLTGPEKPLDTLIETGFLQPVQDNRGQPLEPGQGTVTHSLYFALIDGQGRMRGAYQSQDADERKHLLRDITALEQEAGR